MTIQSGQCACGNRVFDQITQVMFRTDAPATEQIGAGDTRKRLRADRVWKTYACASCGARYLHNAATGDWRGAS